jgi:hypothetical protein
MVSRSRTNLRGKQEENCNAIHKQREEYMVNEITADTHVKHAPATWRCPFFNPIAALCQAALTPRTQPQEARAAACSSEAYEDCTTFLVGLLARPAPRSR